MAVFSSVMSVIISTVLAFLSMFGINIWHPSNRAENAALKSNATVEEAVEYYNAVIKASSKYDCHETITTTTNSLKVDPEEYEAVFERAPKVEIVVNDGSGNDADSFLIAEGKAKNYSCSIADGITTLSFTFNENGDSVFGEETENETEDETKGSSFEKIDFNSTYYGSSVVMKLDSNMKILNLDVLYNNLFEVHDFDLGSGKQQAKLNVSYDSKNEYFIDFYGNGGYQYVKNANLYY